MNPAPILEPVIAATLADPGAVLTVLRLSRLARRWGLTGPLAGALAALAYESRDD